MMTVPSASVVSVIVAGISNGFRATSTLASSCHVQKPSVIERVATMHDHRPVRKAMAIWLEKLSDAEDVFVYTAADTVNVNMTLFTRNITRHVVAHHKNLSYEPL